MKRCEPDNDSYHSGHSLRRSYVYPTNLSLQSSARGWIIIEAYCLSFYSLYMILHLESVDDNPAPIRKLLQVRHKELYTAIPVGQQQHTANQLHDTNLTTMDIQQLEIKDVNIQCVSCCTRHSRAEYLL